MDAETYLAAHLGRPLTIQEIFSLRLWELSRDSTVRDACIAANGVFGYYAWREMVRDVANALILPVSTDWQFWNT